MRPGWIRFRWPTWSAAETASPEIRRSPPGKPANQPSCRLSRLSSYSLWMVSGVCSMDGFAMKDSAQRLEAGLPVDDAFVDRFWIGVGRQRDAHGFVREQFGDLR